ncbi:MAG: hypothetical protein CMB34_05140 [Euryarchaeota archaeon]|nr:hypothetical protein [Euryarchaeota archaeon]|tara:strand:+ start:1293 stop:1700 length:408 start_codon:yes stop_codon:yes gene_type:complete
MTEDNSCTCDPEMVELRDKQHHARWHLGRMSNLYRISGEIITAIETLCEANSDAHDHFFSMLGDFKRTEEDESQDPSTWKGPGVFEHLQDITNDGLCEAARAYTEAHNEWMAYWDRRRRVKDHDSESDTADPSRN